MKEQRLSGDVPAPMLTVEQQQALERIQEIRELLAEIDAHVDHLRCLQLLDELEGCLSGEARDGQRDHA